MGITEEVQELKNQVSDLSKLITSFIAPGETPSEFEPIIAEIRDVKEYLDNMQQTTYDEEVLKQAITDFGNSLQELKELVANGSNLQLEWIQEHFSELKELFEKSACKPTIDEFNFSDEETAKDKVHNRRRDLVLLIATTISIFAAASTTGKFPWGFSFSMGFMLSFGVLDTIVMVLDRFVLPGQTIKRICGNAVATAILLTGFIGCFIGGTAIGYSIITDSNRTEEGTKGNSKPNGIYQEPNKPDTGTGVSTPVQQYNTSESSKEN